MAGIKGKSGGKREGAGRISLKKKEARTSISLSDSAAEALNKYSEELGISKSDIVDALCLLYLSNSNQDILHCPECGKPLAWDVFIQVVECEITCNCGYTTNIKDE